MDGIKFDSDRQIQPDLMRQHEPPKMIKWVIQISGGRIDEQSATRLLLAFALVALLVAVAYPFFFGGVRYQEPPDIGRHGGSTSPSQR